MSEPVPLEKKPAVELMGKHARQTIIDYLQQYPVISVNRETKEATPLLGPPLQKLIEAAFPLMVCGYTEEEDVSIDDAIAQCISHMVEVLPVLANDMYKASVKNEVDNIITKAQKNDG